MKIPDLEKAKKLLAEASEMNPGRWIEHSVHTAEAAKLISSRVPGMDEKAAYIFGYLHDIGRRYGVTRMRHSIDGYNFMMELGYDDIARISLTHSFPYKNIDAIYSSWDCEQHEVEFVKQYLNNIEYDHYDKLIQLCDTLAFHNGFCLLEKRMVDVALRYGMNSNIIPKWKATFEIKDFFESKTGESIYNILPDVAKNTLL